MKRSKILMLSLTMCFLLSISISAKAEYALPFTDVTENNWFYSPLLELYEGKVIDGFTDNTFRPQNTVTKAELIKMLVMIINENFTPIGDREFWLDPYSNYALMVRLIDEVETKEVYNSPITREEVAFYSYRTINAFKNVDEIGKDSYKFVMTSDDIADIDTINSEYKDAVLNLYNMGIFSGYSDTTFKPKQNLTRAELCVVISKLMAKRRLDIASGKVLLKDILGYL